jgi:hypothetical protein
LRCSSRDDTQSALLATPRIGRSRLDLPVPDFRSISMGRTSSRALRSEGLKRWSLDNDYGHGKADIVRDEEGDGQRTSLFDRLCTPIDSNRPSRLLLERKVVSRASPPHGSDRQCDYLEHVEAWTDFAVIAGGAAAALVGLLFVSVSIRADVISKSKGLRSRIAQILTIFLGILSACVFVALPNPAEWVLGIELVVTSLAIGAAFIVLDHRAERGGDAPLATVLDRLNPNVTTAVLVGLAGLTLVLGQTWGLYFLAAASIVAFVGGAVGAWLVLVRADG